MKNYPADKIRNVGIFGHSGEGKTTLTEAMLYNAGLTDRMGRVEDGSTVTDTDPEEKARGISIGAAVAPYEWNGTKVNIIDAPGDFDFYGEVVEGMELADSALIVVGAVSGPVVGSEKMMTMCRKQNKPRMIVINQIDRENANFDKVMDEITAKFGSNVVPIQLPIMDGDKLKGYVDLVNMTAKMYNGKAEKEEAIPANLQDRAESLREALVEAAAEGDAELMDKYFEEMTLSNEETERGLKLGVMDGSITLVTVCSAAQNAGVTTLMDNILKYMPTADHAKLPKVVNDNGEVSDYKPTGKLAARVIKTVADPFAGKVSIIRVYDGELSSSISALNTNAEKSEKSGAVGILTAPGGLLGPKSG